MVHKSLRSYIDILKDQIIETNEMCDICDKAIITQVSYNSMDVKPGTLFICKGANFKEEYLDSAIEKGAVCYLADKMMRNDVPAIIVKDIRESLSIASAHMYDHIWNDKLTEIGITGTKGKSTTTCFIKSILDCAQSNGKTAVVSGIYNYDGNKKEKAILTTPETIELHKILSNSIENGCDKLVMEVSSQGLKYKRVEDLKYKIGVFLNIGVDHISETEHESFEDYFNSKLELFKHCEIACINVDIEEKYLYRILDEAIANKCRIVTFGTRQVAHYRGSLVEDKIDGLTFEMFYSGILTTLKTSIGGYYNMINALAAIAVCKELGVSIKDIEEGLRKAKIPGRMEIFNVPNKDAKIIVDYAHNEMSYNSLFESINRNYPDYKKMFMFGCAADKAFNRRNEAAKIAEKEADKVIITKYDDGKESFDEICKSILRYISPDKDVKVFNRREEAIKYCLDNAQNGWIIILAGCETDAEIVKEYLKRCY